MKNIQTDALRDDSPASPKMTYADLLISSVRDHGGKGVDVEELLVRIPIVRALQAAPIDGEILLTHDQWAKLDGLFRAGKWPVSEGVADVAEALAAEMKVEPGE